jgi:alpha-L-rhamnosidase
VLGINHASPGFATVRIEPNFGDLQFAEGKMPHPLGNISVKLDKMDNGYKAVVMLPKGLNGEMVWRGERKALEGGKVEVLFFK